MKILIISNPLPSLAQFAIEFANEATEPVLVGFVNEINIGADGWAQLAPFGDHPSTALMPDANGKVKKQSAIQRIDKEGCDAMVAGFCNERRGVRKFLKGCNIYVGHPDMPGLGAHYPDKEPKGVIADLEVRADGLYGLPVFNNEGSELVETKKLRAFSGRFGDSVPCGDVNGVPAYRPTRIYSAGLTNTPHLPVHFFNADNTLAEASAEAENKTKTSMKKKLIALCATLGIQFANEADDAQTEAALDQVSTKVAAFANEATQTAATQKSIREKLLGLCAKLGITFANEAAITDPAATLGQVQDKIVTLTSERDAAQTEFANARKAHVDDLIAHGLKSGVITGAEETDWRRRLSVAAQFANERTAFAALTPKVKTKSVTVNRGGREQTVDLSNPQSRAQFINEEIAVVAAELKLNPKEDYDRIYNIVQKRHPAVFELMKQPSK